MAYFVFAKNLPNIYGTLYRIAENQSDLNNLNIIPSDYKIIEVSQDLFTQVQLHKISINFYDNNDQINSTSTFDPKLNLGVYFKNQQKLDTYLNNIKETIKNFLDGNKNHPQFNRWNDYYNQLMDFNTATAPYRINVSWEEYLKNSNQPYYNILQIP
jgi:hypothetical protein